MNSSFVVINTLTNINIKGKCLITLLMNVSAHALGDYEIPT